jgi:hypothetical protein
VEIYSQRDENLHRQADKKFKMAVAFIAFEKKLSVKFVKMLFALPNGYHRLIPLKFEKRFAPFPVRD